APEDAAVIGADESRLIVTAADSNTFAKSAWISHSLAGQTGRTTATAELANSRFHGEGPLFLADGETHRLELSMRHGFGNQLELGLTVPVSTIGGGWSDRLIEMTHHALGIGNADRQSLRQNSETVYIDSGSVHYLRDRSAGYALGDIALTGKYELKGLEGERVNWAWTVAAEHPPANARRLEVWGLVYGALCFTIR